MRWAITIAMGVLRFSDLTVIWETDSGTGKDAIPRL